MLRPDDKIMRLIQHRETFGGSQLGDRSEIIGGGLQAGKRRNFFCGNYHGRIDCGAGCFRRALKTASNSSLPGSSPSRMSAVRSTQPKGSLSLNPKEALR